MKTDLHNHTPLCRHANGAMEDFVKRALACGMDVFGFSDHAPMGFDPQHRMNKDQMDEYETEVLRLKHVYARRIEVLLGYEVDYLPGYMFDAVLNKKVDYLIGSVHFINGWGFDDPQFIDGYKDRDIDEVWTQYFEAIREMAESRLFDIVGHIDLIKIYKYFPKRDVLEIARPALKAIRESGMVIEINSSGMRKPIGEPYPGERLLRKAFEMGIPITFSSDAHELEHIGYGREHTEQMARAIGYTHCAVFHGRKMSLVPF